MIYRKNNLSIFSKTYTQIFCIDGSRYFLTILFIIEESDAKMLLAIKLYFYGIL